MLRRFGLVAIVFGFALLRLAGAAESHAQPKPSAVQHFEDPAHLLPGGPASVDVIDQKLTNVERTSGLRIVGRLFAKSPTAEEDAKAGAYMHALAQKFGTAKRGAFFAYFADEDDWRVWIGDESASTFLGRAASPADLVEDGAFHHAKEAFLKQVHDRGVTEFAQQKSRELADQPLPASVAVKAQTDAMVAGLVDRLARPASR